MDGVSSTLAASQSLYQGQISLLALRMTAQNQQQLAALLAQAAQAAQAIAVNPAHLGQGLDVYA